MLFILSRRFAATIPVTLCIKASQRLFRKPKLRSLRSLLLKMVCEGLQRMAQQKLFLRIFPYQLEEKQVLRKKQENVLTTRFLSVVALWFS